MIPGGQDAQEAGCRDRERRKRNKYTVLGHRPPHTKRRFFCLKKIIFLRNKQKNSFSVTIQMFGKAFLVCIMTYFCLNSS